ncbi:MAG: hypothetical protein CME61_06425 [Halobacteriovoraceae bacterium]|nr:hypothetical protein [Halobacteriovoraceae bacterium]
MHQYRPPLTKINKHLIIALVSIFIIHSIFHLASGAYFSHFFSLNGGTFFSGLIFQILTYPFFASGLFEILFDCLILWFLGGSLESLWGPKKYLQFLLVSVIVGGALFLGVSSFLPAWPSLSGPGALTYPLLIAYGVLYPERDLLLIFFPIKAKWFCLIILGMQTYLGIFSPMGTAAWGNLGAMAGGFLWMVWQTKRNKVQKSNKKKRNSNHLKLVKGGEEKGNDDDPPKYLH